MTDQKADEIEATGPESRTERHDTERHPEVNQPAERPYGDADNLYEIPRILPEDPPLRRWWWIDDEPR